IITGETMKRIWLNAFITAIILFCSTTAWAQIKTRINWTVVTGAQSGMFMAQQEGLFKKNGLDVELIHIPSSSRGIQAILAGEIGFSFMDGANEVQANLKGQTWPWLPAPPTARFSHLWRKRISSES